MLASILLGSSRRRALGVLLLRPEQAYTLSEISRMLGITAGTLHNDLAKLAQAGLLLRDEIGGQIHYSANTRCAIFPELQGLLRKVSGVADVLRETLDKNNERIMLSWIIDPTDKEKEHADGVVDVWIIGNLPLPEAVKALHPAQAMSQREINPVVYQPDDFRRKFSSGDEYLRGIVEGKKLFLNGNEDALKKLVGYPPCIGDGRQ
jgi:DNA-binding transcriptional ArsR family regulator